MADWRPDEREVSILRYLRRYRASGPFTAVTLGRQVSEPFTGVSRSQMGYHRAFAALRRLERRGVVVRLEGTRPALWELVTSADGGA